MVQAASSVPGDALFLSGRLCARITSFRYLPDNAVQDPLSERVLSTQPFDKWPDLCIGPTCSCRPTLAGPTEDSCGTERSLRTLALVDRRFEVWREVAA